MASSAIDPPEARHLFRRKRLHGTKTSALPGSAMEEQCRGGMRHVMLHCLPEMPGPERLGCVVQLGATGEWLVAMWVPEAERWYFAYEEPIIDAGAAEVVMWADLRELLAAEGAKDVRASTSQQLLMAALIGAAGWAVIEGILWVLRTLTGGC